MQLPAVTHRRVLQLLERFRGGKRSGSVDVERISADAGEDVRVSVPGILNRGTQGPNHTGSRGLRTLASAAALNVVEHQVAVIVDIERARDAVVVLVSPWAGWAVGVRTDTTEDAGPNR